MITINTKQFIPHFDLNVKETPPVYEIVSLKDLLKQYNKLEKNEKEVVDKIIPSLCNYNCIDSGVYSSNIFHAPKKNLGETLKMEIHDDKYSVAMCMFVGSDMIDLWNTVKKLSESKPDNVKNISADDCPVCLEKFKEHGYCYTNCGHKYCLDCFTKCKDIKCFCGEKIWNGVDSPVTEPVIDNGQYPLWTSVLTHSVQVIAVPIMIVCLCTLIVPAVSYGIYRGVKSIRNRNSNRGNISLNQNNPPINASSLMEELKSLTNHQQTKDIEVCFGEDEYIDPLVNIV